MTTVTPSQDAARIALTKARSAFEAWPVGTPRDRLSRALALGMLEAVTMPVSEAIDHDVDPNEILSAVENAAANALGGVALTLSADDAGLALKIVDHVVGGIKRRMVPRILDRASPHVVRGRVAAPKAGRG